MIFDSPKMIALRRKYQGSPDYEVPEIVLIDRLTDFAGERYFLENLISKVSQTKQKDWIGRLVNKEPQRHIGAWFEIMLYGWLLENFIVDVEPEINGTYPDFVINGPDYQFAIEAKAFLISPDDRENNQKFRCVSKALESIQKPFLIEFKFKQLGEKIDIKDFLEKVISWLDSEPDKNYIYQDEKRNIILMTAMFTSTFKKAGVASTEAFWVNPDVLKSPLSGKAMQHKALRKIGFPYLIAIFLEPSILTAEEITQAWFGKQVVVFDPDSRKVVEEKIDQSGIHYWGHEIRHKSVTGTLVFKTDYSVNENSRKLEAWYVENPYAKVKIDPYLIPAKSRFIVINQKDGFYQMKWVS